MPLMDDNAVFLELSERTQFSEPVRTRLIDDEDDQHPGNIGALIAVALEKTMKKTGAEREDVWGPIAMTNWRETPCIQGRVATEDDANAGRAVFFLKLSDGQENRPIDLDLPRCAILHEEGEGDLPVIVIQAEEGNNGASAAQLIAGYRPLTGGCGLCMFYQLEFLSEPDDRFAESPPR
jgi:hypothetical protein